METDTDRIEELRRLRSELDRRLAELVEDGRGATARPGVSTEPLEKRRRETTERVGLGLNARCAVADDGREVAAFRFFSADNAGRAIAVVQDAESGTRCVDVRRELAASLTAHLRAKLARDRSPASWSLTDDDLAACLESDDAARRLLPQLRRMALGSLASVAVRGRPDSVRYVNRGVLRTVSILGNDGLGLMPRKAVHDRSLGVWPDPEHETWRRVPAAALARDMLAAVDPGLLALARALKTRPGAVDLPGGGPAREWLRTTPWAVEVRSRLEQHAGLIEMDEARPDALAADAGSPASVAALVRRCAALYGYLVAQEACLAKMHEHRVPPHSGARVPLKTSVGTPTTADHVSSDVGFGAWRDFFPAHLTNALPGA